MAQKYLKDKAYAILREKIINCEYAPGTVLNETELIAEIGASRTPVHDALVTLAGENLVTIIPKKGVIVNGITLEDVLEVYDVRSMIEPEIVRRYGELIDKAYLEDYVNRCGRAVTLQEKISLDEELHAQLYAVCRNRYLRDILKQLEGHNHRNRVWRSNESRVNMSMEEHIAIVRFLLQNQYEEAAKMMFRHIDNARIYALKKYV